MGWDQRLLLVITRGLPEDVVRRKKAGGSRYSPGWRASACPTRRSAGWSEKSNWELCPEAWSTAQSVFTPEVGLLAVGMRGQRVRAGVCGVPALLGAAPSGSGGALVGWLAEDDGGSSAMAAATEGDVRLELQIRREVLLARIG